MANKQQDQLKPVLLIAGALIAFSAISRIFTGLGIFESQESKNVDATASSSTTFWSPTYWKQFPYNSFSYRVTFDMATQFLKTITDSFGAFNDCEECVKGVFRLMRTKSNVSYLADVFQQQGNGDLFTYLRGGWWPQDRLSDSDLNEINNFLSQLPTH